MPTLSERFDELRHACRNAEQRVREAEAEHRRAGRTAAVAENELREVFEEAATEGREPDQARVDDLRNALRNSDEGVVLRPLADGRVEAIDPAAEGRLRGSRQALDAALSALQAFKRDRANIAGIAAERFERAKAIGQRYVAAIDQLVQAEGEWFDESRFLLHELGVHEDDVPVRPLEVPGLGQGIADFMQRRANDPASLIPAPAWLVREQS